MNKQTQKSIEEYNKLTASYYYRLYVKGHTDVEMIVARSQPSGQQNINDLHVELHGGLHEYTLLNNLKQVLYFLEWCNTANEDKLNKIKGDSFGLNHITQLDDMIQGKIDILLECKDVISLIKEESKTL